MRVLLFVLLALFAACRGERPNVAALISDAAANEGREVVAIGWALDLEGSVLCETKDEFASMNPRCVDILGCPAPETRTWNCALGGLSLPAAEIGTIARSGRLVRVRGEFRSNQNTYVVHSARELGYVAP